MFNTIMFGVSGFTMSKATHYANIAKEIADQKLSALTNQRLFTAIMHYNGTKITRSTADFSLEKSVSDIDIVKDLMRASAWLREAVKQHREKMSSIEQRKFVYSVSPPTPPKLVEQVDDKYGISQLTIKELNEYYSLEASAAAIGHLIHNNGVVKTWVDQISTYADMVWDREHPVEVSMDVNPEEITGLFFSLQQSHRDLNSRLNYLKSKVHSLIHEKNLEIQSTNSHLITTHGESTRLYNNDRSLAGIEFERKKSEEIREISKLRVVIPHDLQSTIDLIATYAGGGDTH